MRIAVLATSFLGMIAVFYVVFVQAPETRKSIAACEASGGLPIVASNSTFTGCAEPKTTN